MKEWPYSVQYYSRDLLQVLTRDPNWQIFRKSLMSMPPEEKLDHLQRRLDAASVTTAEGIRFDPSEKARIDNYPNAMMRGGALNDRYQVQPKAKTRDRIRRFQQS